MKCSGLVLSKLTFILILSLSVGILGAGIGSLRFWTEKVAKAALPVPSTDSLSMVWLNLTPGSGAGDRVLKKWSIDELSHQPMLTSTEEDPLTHQKSTWRGLLLAKLVVDAVEQLSPEDKSQFDLVILRGNAGETAYIPRAFIAKYRFFLAVLPMKKGADLRGPLYSVVPWTSNPKILTEDLPLESFFVPNVKRIELTNYVAQYGALFLKRRTDPSAIRGEKIFVQSCTGCHALKQGSSFIDVAAEERANRYFAGNHPAVKGVVKLSEKSRKSISRYLNAYRMENSLSLSSSAPHS